MEGRLALLLALLPVFASGANILGLMSCPSPSHHNWNRQIFLKLAAKGHNLTVLSPDIDREVTPGLHYLHAEKVYPNLYNSTEFKVTDFVVSNPFMGALALYDFLRTFCPGYHSSEGFKKLLSYPDDFKFDLVLVDYTMEPCLIPFIEKFQYPPTVGLSAFSVPHYSYEFIGGHRQLSYVPHFYAEFDSSMTFEERFWNFLYYKFDDLYRKFIVFPEFDVTFKKVFKKPNLPSLTEMMKKIILVLVNTHFALEKVEPLPPNVIPVGGLQIQDPKPVDPELEEYFQKARKGVVLFSLGTNMKSEYMDARQKEIFVEAFKQIPDYNFIWKYESDLKIPLPSNVKTLGWVRQNDILAHPKTRAFISHCGLLGTQEAAWYGVPVVGIPFFADQFRNIRAGIREGTGVKLDHFNLTVENIKAGLVKVLETPSYYTNAQRRASLFRDQPEKPIDRALFWLEWVMRHKTDYQAIKLPILELGPIASHSYDVIAVLLGAGVSLVFITSWILVKLLCSRAKKEVKQKRH